MSDDNNRVAWPIVEARDAAAVRFKRENADLRAMLREIRRTVIASVRGEEHAATLTDEDVDAHAASTPVDVGNLVARMQSAEAQVAYLAANLATSLGVSIEGGER